MFGVATTAFVFGFGRNMPLYAYVSDVVSTNQVPVESKLNLNPISNIHNITAPVNNLINSVLKGIKFNIGTSIPLSPLKSPSQNTDYSKFFSSSKVSSNDITSFLKEAAITAINLTIIVISITGQVLKGLLSVFKQ